MVLFVSAMKTLPSSATSTSSGRFVAKWASNSALPNRARSLVEVSSSASSGTSTQRPVPSVALIGVVSPAAAKRRRPSGSQRAM